jgi:hypothetical protein
MRRRGQSWSTRPADTKIVIIATEHTEDAAMITGNVPPVRPLRPFLLIAGLLAHWYAAKFVRARTKFDNVTCACNNSSRNIL